MGAVELFLAGLLPAWALGVAWSFSMRSYPRAVAAVTVMALGIGGLYLIATGEPTEAAADINLVYTAGLMVGGFIGAGMGNTFHDMVHDRGARRGGR